MYIRVQFGIIETSRERLKFTPNICVFLAIYPHYLILNPFCFSTFIILFFKKGRPLMLGIKKRKWVILNAHTYLMQNIVIIIWRFPWLWFIVSRTNFLWTKYFNKYMVATCNRYNYFLWSPMFLTLNQPMFNTTFILMDQCIKMIPKLYILNIEWRVGP